MLQVPIKYKVTMAISNGRVEYGHSKAFYFYFVALIYKYFMQKKGYRHLWTNTIYKVLIGLDYSKLNNIELDGIDRSDYPDFCDAYISGGYYGNRRLTDTELDLLNEDRDFVYNAVQDYLY